MADGVFQWPEERQHTSLLGISQRLPPSNLQAEQAVLGSLLANNRSYERVVDFLEPRHFADPVHARIYLAITERILLGKLADAVTLKTDFENGGVLAEVGGTAYLAQLLSSMVGIINAGEYGRAIVDAWQRRQLIELGETVVNNAFGADPALDGGKQIDLAEQSLGAIRLAGKRGDRMSSVGALVNSAITQAEAVYKGQPSRRVLTGIPTIDRALRLLPGTLTLLAGPPGAGKTALAVQIGKSIAKLRYAENPTYNQPGVAFFSLEMSGEELGERIAAHEAEIPLDDLLDGKLDMATTANLIRAESALRNVPLRIWDCTETSLRLIPRKIRLHLASRPEALVIVDHLHVAGGEDDRRNEGAATAALAGAFKALAREMDVPIVLLAHMPKPARGVEVRRPTQFDVKYGGEGSADIVVFPHRPIMFMDTREPEQKPKETDEAYTGPNGRLTRWRYALEAARDLAEIVVAKQRQGRKGVYRMRWMGRFTSFAEWEGAEPEWQE